MYVTLAFLKEDLPFNKVFPETKLAIDAITEAGNAVMKFYENEFVTKLKNDSEPVTDADISSNEIIQRILSPSGHLVLSEESIDDKKRLERERVWIVDPLDGTTDFVNRTGEFTIMVSLVENHKPILGVILSPSSKELYVSQKDQGAYHLNEGRWIKIRCNDVADLKKCRAVGSRFHLSQQEKQILEKSGIQKFTQRGSSLKVIDICLGKAELYMTTTDKMKQWDTCASHSLITEAGGKMTDVYGKELSYNDNSLRHENGLVVTNGKIHNDVLKILANQLKLKNNNL